MPSLLDLRRTLAALIAVALSAALIAFAFIVSGSFRTQMEADARASVGDADVVILPLRGEELSQETVDAVSATPGVASVRPFIEGRTFVDRPGNAYDYHAFVLDIPDLTGNSVLTAGRLPEAAGEIAVSPFLAQQQDIEIGSTIAFVNDSGDHASRSTALIVGIVQPSAEVTRWDPRDVYVFATAEERAALGVPEAPALLYVSAEASISASDLADAVSEAVRGEAQVYTAKDIVTMRAETSNGSVGSATFLMLSILEPVCAVVAAIIIATTFTTLVARQTRQIGLLRCVGASQRQVRLAVLRSAVLTGLVGSVLGAAAGAAAAAGVIQAGGIDSLAPEYLTISPVSLEVAILIGSTITLVATLRPAHQATRVSPLVALAGKVSEDRTLDRRRLVAAIAGSVIAVIGAVVTGLGVSARVLEYTATGAVVLVLGILAALPLLVVGTARVAERLSGSSLPILQLACRNLARNPGRAAATSASLLVSVVVASSMLTGLASIEASMDDYLSSGSPIDIRIQGVTAGQDVESLTDRVEAVDGVEATVLVPEMDVQVASAGTQAEEITVSAVDEDAVSPVIRSRVGLEGLDDNTLVIGGIYGMPEGSQVTLTGPAGSTTLTVHVEEGGFGPVITPDVAHQLFADTPTPASLWVRTTGDGSSTAPVSEIRTFLHGSGLMVSSSDDGRSSFTQLLNRITAVIVTVLGLTLLISLSGLANITDISVLERTQEIGVLRATGTQRREIRRLVITEAVLTAVLGGLIGVVLGCALGMAGCMALLSTDSGDFTTIRLPWLSLAGVLLAAGAVGILAALRPARRASRVTPVAALAVD